MDLEPTLGTEALEWTSHVCPGIGQGVAAHIVSMSHACVNIIRGLQTGPISTSTFI